MATASLILSLHLCAFFFKVDSSKLAAVESIQTGQQVEAARAADSSMNKVHVLSSNATSIKRHHSSLPDWIAPFVGDEFEKYRQRIDEEISRQRQAPQSRKVTCNTPLYTGEYGYELAVMVPWAYHTSQSCPVVTEGVVGTEYLYYFSHQHTIARRTKRRYRELPEGNPFQQNEPHTSIDHFPQDNWTMPPYKTRYHRDDVSFDKPLMMIFNKYTREWRSPPVNYIPLDTLDTLLDYLTPNYHIIYIRLEHKKLDDKASLQFGDKAMIRSKYPNVVILDDLIQRMHPDAVNLMIFSLSAQSVGFISVQGGNSVVASIFGGINIILAKRGPELEQGDYTYYRRFSGADIIVVHDEIKLLAMVKSKMTVKNSTPFLSTNKAKPVVTN